MPIAHVAIFIALNLIYIEHIETFDNVILYFIPFIALTVLGGVWGFNMTIRMLAPHNANLKLPQKYFAFQLVLVLCKLQPVVLSLVMASCKLDCDGPFTVLVKRRSELNDIVR
jgi:organic solute transporter subunit alpha